jgi:hypothetical protein
MMHTRAKATQCDSPYACVTASNFLMGVLPEDLTRLIVAAVWGRVLSPVRRDSPRALRCLRRH